jgi:TolB-like protein/DNA-binding winged helix-turn-helix (wHTH) protein
MGQQLEADLVLRFGGFVLDLGRAELRDAAGGIVPLRPKTRALLEHLLAHAGRAEDRAAILDAVWPGITVGDESLSQAVAELRRALGAEGPRLIRTVPRLGYMLDAEVTVVQSRKPQLRAGTSGQVSSLESGSDLMHGRRAIPEGPAVAVLPFEVLGGGEDDRWLADGLADDLITGLGPWGWFPVIARQSSFSYRGKPIPAGRIACELGAGYLVEGTLRRAAERLRVTVRLMDGVSGRQLWAADCERPVTHLFDARSELLSGILGQLEMQLARNEAERAVAAAQPEDLDAYVAVQRARWHHARLTQADSAEARRLLRKAIAIAPDYSLAWGMLARATAVAAEMDWTNGPRPDGFAEAFDLAREAVRLGASGESWYSLGEVHLLAETGWNDCLAAFDEALSCNPSHVAARARLTTPLACTGRSAEAVQAAEIAMRLSPRDPRTPTWLSGLAVARYLLGEYEAAVAAARRSLLLRPGWAPVHHPLAVSLARLGRREEAAAVFGQLLRLEPDAMERTEHFVRGFGDDGAARHWLKGMRLAAASG